MDQFINTALIGIVALLGGGIAGLLFIVAELQSIHKTLVALKEK